MKLFPQIRIAFTLSILLAVFCTQAAAQGGASVRGSGRVTLITRSVAGFHGVVLELPADLTIIQGATEGVTVETDDNIAPWIETAVSAGQLVLRARQGASIQPSALKIGVHIRKVDSVAVSGAGNVHANGLEAPDLTLQISGSGDMHLAKIKANTLNLSVSGAGNVWASGQVETLGAGISGTGDLQMESLAAKHVRLSIAGSGDATVWASQTLAVTVGGAGDVKYYGDAVLTQTITGAGSVTRLGSSPKTRP